jgi:ketosteroid isomerase-like protein
MPSSRREESISSLQLTKSAPPSQLIQVFDGQKRRREGAMRTGWRCIAGSGLLLLVAGIGAAAAGSATPESPDDIEFRAFLNKVNEAQVEFVQGRAAAFKALWSHRPDVTIFGGFGSGDHGWEKVDARLDWGSTQFSKGSRSHEVLSTHVGGDVGYVVQIERIRFTVPGQSKESSLELRATMIMRREAEGWRLVHRHADSQVTRQAPQ